jgi:hypothetical protein
MGWPFFWLFGWVDNRCGWVGNHCERVVLMKAEGDECWRGWWWCECLRAACSFPARLAQNFVKINLPKIRQDPPIKFDLPCQLACAGFQLWNPLIYTMFWRWNKSCGLWPNWNHLKSQFLNAWYKILEKFLHLKEVSWIGLSLISAIKQHEQLIMTPYTPYWLQSLMCLEGTLRWRGSLKVKCVQRWR